MDNQEPIIVPTDKDRQDAINRVDKLKKSNDPILNFLGKAFGTGGIRKGEIDNNREWTQRQNKSK